MPRNALLTIIATLVLTCSVSPGRASEKPSQNIPSTDWLETRSESGAYWLGLLVGYGSGHYYAGDTSKGINYLYWDIGLSILLFALEAPVALSEAQNSDDQPLVDLNKDTKTALQISAAVVAVGFIVERFIQASSAEGVAKKTNKQLDILRPKILPLIGDGQHSGLGLQLAWRF